MWGRTSGVETDGYRLTNPSTLQFSLNSLQTSSSVSKTCASWNGLYLEPAASTTGNTLQSHPSSPAHFLVHTTHKPSDRPKLATESPKPNNFLLKGGVCNEVKLLQKLMMIFDGNISEAGTSITMASITER
jgi:hypothetical protein